MQQCSRCSYLKHFIVTRLVQVLEPQGCPGLCEGDLIVEINQQGLQGLNHSQVVQILKDCAVGTEATLIIQRGAGTRICLLFIFGLNKSYFIIREERFLAFAFVVFSCKHISGTLFRPCKKRYLIHLQWNLGIRMASLTNFRLKNLGLTF